MNIPLRGKIQITFDFTRNVNRRLMDLAIHQTTRSSYNTCPDPYETPTTISAHDTRPLLNVDYTSTKRTLILKILWLKIAGLHLICRSPISSIAARRFDLICKHLVINNLSRTRKFLTRIEALNSYHKSLKTTQQQAIRKMEEPIMSLIAGGEMR